MNVFDKESLKKSVQEYFNIINKNLPSGSLYEGHHLLRNEEVTIYYTTKSGKKNRWTVSLDEVVSYIRSQKINSLFNNQHLDINNDKTS